MTMYYPPVEDPVPLPQAFASEGENATQSQATLLLLLGAARESGGASAARSVGVTQPLVAEEDREALQVPEVAIAAAGEQRTMKMDTLRRRRSNTSLRRAIRASREDFAPAMGEIAGRLHESGNPDDAASLIVASLSHPSPIVQVAAASAAFDFFEEDDLAEPMRILQMWSFAQDPFTRSLARTALGRVAPASGELTRLKRKSLPPIASKATHTAMIVHGTFARQNAWWQFGGDFHTYLTAEVRPDVYAAADRYDWSGGYSDGARSRAARDLTAWIAGHGLGGLDLFCHSHGGNVAMLASKNTQVAKMVLMSCPVHEGKYDPDPSIGDIVSFRVRMDLVILVDRGGQRFRDPRIRENVLPIWFNHSATHEPQVWRDRGLPAKL